MASFEAKIGWKRPGKRENANYPFCFVLTQCIIENSEQIANKIEKLKNTIMAQFQAKIKGETPRKRENKNYRFVPFQPAA